MLFECANYNDKILCSFQPHTPNQLSDISEIIARDEREGLNKIAINKLKRAILQKVGITRCDCQCNV